MLGTLNELSRSEACDPDPLATATIASNEVDRVSRHIQRDTQRFTLRGRSKLRCFAMFRKYERRRSAVLIELLREAAEIGAMPVIDDSIRHPPDLYSSESGTRRKLDLLSSVRESLIESTYLVEYRPFDCRISIRKKGIFSKATGSPRAVSS